MEGSITSSLITEINNRQNSIVEDFSQSTAIVVGLGGIGNWIAVDLALLGCGTLILFDPDKIEPSNLNRTLFKLSHIGQYKTKAVKELIMERRRDVLVITYEEYFSVDDLKKLNGTNYIFDCSDTTKLKDSLALSKEKKNDFIFPNYIKLGYDGMEGTISINDFISGRWGEDNSYTVVPSFFGTPQVLSAIGIIEMLLVKKPVNRTVNLNVKSILNLIS